jgi:hypothetical protein
MLLQGVHPNIVSERLGHASIGITLDTYSHVLPSMQAEAVRASTSSSVRRRQPISVVNVEGFPDEIGNDGGRR